MTPDPTGGRGSTGGLFLSGIGKSFGDHRVLVDVTLTVPRGSVTAVLGPSGCGKTTMLRIVAGFEQADCGTAALDGQHLWGGPAGTLAPHRRRIGLLPQEGALFPHLDVAGNVAFGLPRTVRGTARRRLVDDRLELVGLTGWRSARPQELSGGMQQRVALARALAAEPALLLLDEPFSSLDAALRVRVREDIAATLRAVGTTALLVTHDQSEALSLSDQVVLLLDGRVVQAGSPRELYEDPVSLAAAGFVGDVVVLPGEPGPGDTADCALGRVRLRHAPPRVRRLAVTVRPEQLELSVPDDQAGVRGTVIRSSYRGADTAVTVELDGGGRVTARGDGRWSAGARVQVTVSGPACAFPEPTGASAPS